MRFHNGALKCALSVTLAYVITLIALLSILIYIIYNCIQDGLKLNSLLATGGLAFLLLLCWYTAFDASIDSQKYLYKYMKQRHSDKTLTKLFFNIFNNM